MITVCIAGLLAASIASASLVAPHLSPGLKCSACEVTAREIFRGYNISSVHDKFAGTDVQVEEVLEEACLRVGRYRLMQEAFGSHMKVFADPTEKYDVQNVEPATYYAPGDKENYERSLVRLHSTCQDFVGSIDDLIGGFIKRRAPELEVRRFMCLERNDVCTKETLADYKARESRRRKKWKKESGKSKKVYDKLLNEIESGPKKDL